MYLLHGVQGRHLRGFVRNDGERTATAFFVCPHEFDPQVLMCTLSCAIYHAIGIGVLNAAISEKSTLQTHVQKVGGVYLTVFHSRMQVRHLVSPSKYVLQGTESYPYGKRCDIDTGELVHVGSVEIDDGAFAGCIHKNSLGRRFFQKKNGEEQCIKGCDMMVLGKMCAEAAEMAFPKVSTLMGES